MAQNDGTRPGLSRDGHALRTIVVFFVGVAVAAIGLTGCTQEETVESKVTNGCMDAMKKERPIGPSGPNDAMTDRYIDPSAATLVDMAFADLVATAGVPSGATEMWTVEGTATATWEKNISSVIYDDGGKPDQLPSVTEKFSCEMGFRSTDGAVVAFEYTTFHPTSGGRVSKVLVQRDGDR